MATVTTVPGHGPAIQDESYVANEDLSTYKNTLVAFVAQSSGKPKVGRASGQGVQCAGVLLNTPTSGQVAQIRRKGYAKISATSTHNSGINLTTSGVSGKVEAAASGDFVAGTAEEASAVANQLVAVNVDCVSNAQLN